jgi:nitronate monooxygenase
MSIGALQAAVREAKALTDRPVAVNVLLADRTPPRGDPLRVREAVAGLRDRLGLEAAEPTPPPPGGAELVAAGLEAGAEVVATGLGDPASVVGIAREHGAPVVAMVATVADARRAAASGADALVAQGAEAGGHRSNFAVGDDGTVPMVGTMALVPQVVDAVDVPVIAAGGIMDGRGVAAALALGAQGAQLGTRFLATEEAGVPDSYKRRVAEARDTETVITTAISGRPARGIRNALIEAMGAAEPANLGYPRQQAATGALRAEAMRRGEDDLIALWAGQAAGLAAHGSAGEVVADIVAEADRVLRVLRAGG